MIRFARDERGGLVPIFAIMLPVLILAIGAALGVGNKWYTAARLQTMADQASLAAVQAPEAERAQVAADYIAANNDTGLVVTPTVTPGSDETVTVELSAEVPATLTAPAQTIEKKAKAARKPNADVVLLINTSAAMASEIANVKTMAKEFVDRVAGPHVKIAVVPFGGAVNVADLVSDPDSPPSWILSGDTPAGFKEGDWQEYGGGSPSKSNFALWKNLRDASGNPIHWRCVEARDWPRDLANDVPNTTGTKFVPYLAPDEPDPWTCTKSTCDYACAGGSCAEGGSTTYNGAAAGVGNNYLPDTGFAPTHESNFAQTSCPASFRPFEFDGSSVVPDRLHLLAGEAPNAGTPFSFVGSGTPAKDRFYFVGPGIFDNATRHEVSLTAGGAPMDFTSGPAAYALAHWTCASCTGGFGKSEQLALGGASMPTGNPSFCKFGTASTAAKIAANTIAQGPNFNCPAQSVTRLTNDAGAIKARIDALATGGSADFPNGLAWGWHLLASSWNPYLGNGAGAEADTDKYLVFISGGLPDVLASSKFTGSGYSARGYLAKNRCGSACDQDWLIDRTRDICGTMKTPAAGIKIRVAYVGLGGVGLMSACGEVSEDGSPNLADFPGLANEVIDVGLVE